MSHFLDRLTFFKRIEEGKGSSWLDFDSHRRHSDSWNIRLRHQTRIHG